MSAALDVLLVEDSESDAKLVVRELRRTGFAPRWERVETASALRQALQRREWQLVISDSSVPGIDALDALTLTKEIAPEVPFIVVSGTITEEAAVEAMRRGAADYVTKENLKRLGPAISRELQQARGMREAPGGAPAIGTSHRMLADQEAERRRIARGLHDQFGGLLTSLKLDLQSSMRERGAARTLALADALALVEQAIQQVRDFAVELWPTILDDAGLPAALRWLADRQARWSGFATSLELANLGRLPFAVEAACFRIVQEALTNVARHAEARTVHIRLRKKHGAIEVEVRDDGKGFDPRAARKRAAAGASLGLLGMQERAVLAGGQLGIESTPGQGTTVSGRFPVKEGPSR